MVGEDGCYDGGDGGDGDGGDGDGGGDGKVFVVILGRRGDGGVVEGWCWGGHEIGHGHGNQYGDGKGNSNGTVDGVRVRSVIDG